ncbi:YkgJ family cysteine cluster protein [Luteimonas sp. SX5]|uniref:YkgJ family cysteine cluster protein n=1 Tax=Luteimonas galliterrae TaxID=2940486 RepID=A0ABT0MLV4_9GAMM|nr:YkgJ family cysteine cluster protein [Luteimonas galliterrae]MCL1635876.1 YkgJ family cysteine cluster protein [Luteimonas galliterrae]
MPHPCQSCGACCAAFRVSFHWLGLASAGGAIPDALAEPVDKHRMAMKGTDARNPHCVALQGAVGTQVSCSIYGTRPDPCRDLLPAWENGQASPQCDRARQRYGLPPLMPEIWFESVSL